MISKLYFFCFSQGRFEILSLTGSFMPSDNGVTKSRSGGLSVSLAGPDGRVLGGGLAGMLVAAGPVQVTRFSWRKNTLSLWEEQTHPFICILNKSKVKSHCFLKLFEFQQIVIGSFLPGGSQPEQKPKKPKYEQTISFGAVPTNPISEASYGGAKPNLTSSVSFLGDNMATVNSIHGNNVSLAGEDSREQSHDLTCWLCLIFLLYLLYLRFKLKSGLGSFRLTSFFSSDPCHRMMSWFK